MQQFLKTALGKLQRFFPEYKPGLFDVWALGISIVLGGQYSGWNVGFEAGFGTFSIIAILYGCAYLCLICCIAELSSALPFAGGAWGLARVTLGFYPGYLIGCCETLEYIFWSSVYFLYATDMLTANDKLIPLLWLLFYGLSFFIHMVGPRVFWPINAIFAIISVLVILLYCIASFSSGQMNLSENAPYDGQWFVGGGTNAMRIFPIAAWLFIGIEGVAFACDAIETPTQVVPKGMLYSMVTLFITSVLVVFISASIPPGLNVLAYDSQPLSFGFETMGSHLSHAELQYLSLPAIFIGGTAFLMQSSKLLLSMTRAHIFPAFIGRRSGKDKIPVVALFLVSAIGYFLCLLIHYASSLRAVQYNLAALAAFTGYISQCVGFIIFRNKFGKLKREFHSPLGIPGAIFAILVFSVGMISIIGFQEDQGMAVVSYFVVIILMSIYYCFIQKAQTLSPEEEKIMFIAYVVNSNISARRKIVSMPSRRSSITQAIADKFGGSADFLKAFMLHTGLTTTSQQALDEGDEPAPSERRLPTKLSTLLVGDEGSDALSKMSTYISSADESCTFGDEWNLDDLYIGACVTVAGVVSVAKDGAQDKVNPFSEPITSGSIPTDDSGSSSVEEQGVVMNVMHKAI